MIRPFLCCEYTGKWQGRLKNYAYYKLSLYKVLEAFENRKKQKSCEKGIDKGRSV